jgi:tripartite-type tricarboxylate transporter receptor subunit TctC
MIVPFAAGGTGDVIGRVLAERMRALLGQPVIIENVAGADGSIGTGRASRSRPDGYTIDLGFKDTNVLNGLSIRFHTTCGMISRLSRRWSLFGDFFLLGKPCHRKT